MPESDQTNPFLKPEFEETEDGHVLSEAFSELGPGFYILKCMQKEALHPDIIRHEYSVMFRLE